MQLLDLFLIFLVLKLLHPLHELAGLIPEIVVADIHFDLRIVNINRMGADRVQKVTVM